MLGHDPVTGVEAHEWNVAWPLRKGIVERRGDSAESFRVAGWGCLGRGGLELVAVELEQVVGGGDEAPFRAGGGSAAT